MGWEHFFGGGIELGKKGKNEVRWGEYFQKE